MVLTAATMITAPAYTNAHAGARQESTHHVTTKWRTLPEHRGTYRVHVTCPTGTTPRSGSVTVRDVKYRGVDVPKRWKGGSQGVNGNAWYAKLHLRQGPTVQVKLHVRCR